MSVQRSAPLVFNTLVEQHLALRDQSLVAMMEFFDAAPIFTHCTLVGDIVFDGSNDSGTGAPVFRNSVLWSDRFVAVDGGGSGSAGSPFFTHCLVKGALFPFGDTWDPGVGVNGGGNIDAAVNFLPGTPRGRVAFDSPVIDAGEAVFLPADEDDADGDGDVMEPYPYSLLGRPRSFGDGPDMGAFEFLPALSDSDGDGFTDEFEQSLTGHATSLALPSLAVVASEAGATVVIEADARLDGQSTFVLEGSADLGAAERWGALGWMIRSSAIEAGVLRIEIDRPPDEPAAGDYFFRLRVLVP